MRSISLKHFCSLRDQRRITEVEWKFYLVNNINTKIFKNKGGNGFPLVLTLKNFNFYKVEKTIAYT